MDTRRMHFVVRAVAALAACACAGLACADDVEALADDDVPPAAPSRLALSTTQQTVAPTGAPPAAFSLQRSSGTPQFQSATQTMAWARRDRIAIGLGVEQRWPSSAEIQGFGPQPGARDANVLVGVALNTTPYSQLSWQRSLGSLSPNPAEPAAGANPGEVRLALTMRKRDALSDIRKGSLLKMEIASGTTLSIKPKHGRLGLTFQSQW